MSGESSKVARIQTNGNFIACLGLTLSFVLNVNFFY